MGDFEPLSKSRRPLIYAKHLEPKKSCCRDSDPDSDEQDFDGCCGIKREICYQNLYFPPRRSHNAHQSYAHVLTPLCIILDIICGLAISFMFGSHEYLHMKLKVLLYTVVGVGILFSTTIVLHGLCIISWWKSCSCTHYKFMGDFDETEQDYQTGFKAARDIENGNSTLAFFSEVSPFVDEDDYAQRGPLHDSDIESFSQQHCTSKNGPGEQNLRATANFIEQQNQIFYAKIEKFRRAKSALAMAESVPCISCWCTEPSDYVYDDNVFD